MPKPILVIHGVANRDKQAFLDEVDALSQQLNAPRADYTLIPVWWGDIAEESFHVNDVLPETNAVRGTDQSANIALGMGLLNLSSAPTSTAASIVGSGTVRDTNTAQAIVTKSATSSSGGVRAGNPLVTQAVKDAIREQWSQTQNLKNIHDAAVLQEVGNAIGEAVQGANGSSSGASLVRGPLDNVKNFVKGVLTGLDKGVGAVVGNIGGTVNETLRSSLGPGLTRFLGDIFVYQHRRTEIQQRLWDAVTHSAPGFGVAGNPISVVAHSLGSVVSFDTAISGTPPLFIDGFVTFGGQPSYFYVMDSSGDGLPVYQPGQQTRLPASINRWTNLWEPMDVLAFLQGRVFKMASGETPLDVELPHLASAGLWTHSAYWTRPELVDAIRNTV